MKARHIKNHIQKSTDLIYCETIFFIAFDVKVTLLEARKCRFLII